MRKIKVQVKLNRNKEGVERMGENQYIVWTKKPAKENKANEDVANQLAKFFCVPKSNIVIMSGAKSKIKVFRIG